MSKQHTGRPTVDELAELVRRGQDHAVAMELRRPEGWVRVYAVGWMVCGVLVAARDDVVGPVEFAPWSAVRWSSV